MVTVCTVFSFFIQPIVKDKTYIQQRNKTNICYDCLYVNNFVTRHDHQTQKSHNNLKKWREEKKKNIVMTVCLEGWSLLPRVYRSWQSKLSALNFTCLQTNMLANQENEANPPPSFFRVFF